METGPILGPHGGYRTLKAFRVAEIICDGTVAFCRRFVSSKSRTTDQMIQAARSGKQNIAEGSMAAGTSKSMEIKLTGVARASLEELLLDYEDYLRQNDLQLWEKDHRKAVFIRNLSKKPDNCYETYRIYLEDKTPETAANTMICLVRQANFLLDKLKGIQEKTLIEDGGVNEKIYAARVAARLRS